MGSHFSRCVEELNSLCSSLPFSWRGSNFIQFMPGSWKRYCHRVKRRTMLLQPSPRWQLLLWTESHLLLLRAPLLVEGRSGPQVSRLSWPHPSIPSVTTCCWFSFPEPAESVLLFPPFHVRHSLGLDPHGGSEVVGLFPVRSSQILPPLTRVIWPHVLPFSAFLLPTKLKLPWFWGLGPFTSCIPQPYHLLLTPSALSDQTPLVPSGPFRVSSHVTSSLESSLPPWAKCIIPWSACASSKPSIPQDCICLHNWLPQKSVNSSQLQKA